ncbi:MAG: hypothetical protein ABIQ02_00495 [Saprospiraceae bacterium]
MLYGLYACGDTHCNPELFTGITLRDYNGSPLSAEDPDDWTFNDNWHEGIRNFFSEQYETNCNPTYTYSIVAYPNPCNGIFALSFGKDSLTKVDIRVVNFVCGTLVSLSTTQHENNFQLEPKEENRIVRVYYKFIKEGCEFQGHGDVAFIK